MKTSLTLVFFFLFTDILANSPDELAEEYAIHDFEGFYHYCSSNFLDNLCSSELASATTFFLTVRE